jgi:diaminohydroxyphosphoribosylaminopyrimidine deaminase/5-amino-6-(5-phosphoribosylamino)uracil reductase
VDAVLEAQIARVVVAVRDPNPKTAGIGVERLLAAGIEVELPGGELEWRARVQNEGYRTWISEGRPFVTYKVAVTLDGRVTVPGSRWVSSEQSRQLVHELRATVDAVAVGMGTVRLDQPRLTARGVDALRQPRRLAFGRGPLPAGSDLELLSGPLREELGRLAEEGVQTLLLEGGPTLASSFLDAGLVDKVLLFVAPSLSGDGLHAFGDLAGPVDLLRLRSRQVGPDLLLEGYLREP